MNVTDINAHISRLDIIPLGDNQKFSFSKRIPKFFSVLGILGLLWFVLWCMTVSDNPQSDPRITDDELNYINSTLGSQASHVKVVTINVVVGLIGARLQ